MEGVTAEIHIRAIFDDIEDEEFSIWLETLKNIIFWGIRGFLLAKAQMIA